MSTDLDAAVARLEERCRHGELRRVGVVSADVRLLLADWKRLREMTSPAAGLARLEQELGIMDKTIAERDAARAEVERLREKLSNTRTTCAYCEAVHELPCTFDDIRAHIEVCPKHPVTALKGELARLRERDARVRSILQRVDDEACKTNWSGNPDDLPESRPLDNEAVAMDMREALELLKETP